MTPTLEEVKKVAIECGITEFTSLEGGWFESTPEELQAFAQHWMKEQRESDAQICDELKSMDYCVDVREAAKAIRNNTGE